jgi:hypothetical protein
MVYYRTTETRRKKQKKSELKWYDIYTVEQLQRSLQRNKEEIQRLKEKRNKIPDQPTRLCLVRSEMRRHYLRKKLLESVVTSPVSFLDFLRMGSRLLRERKSTN